MTKTRFLAFITALALLLTIPTAAFAQSARPHIFVGTVTLDGATAVDGTAVTAWVDGVEVKATSVGDGKYSLLVGDDDGYADGATVEFRVGDATAEQTGSWEEGGGTELDLTAGQAPEPVVDSGEKGDQGDQGTQGTQGTQGDKGDKGDAGARGGSGSKGKTGDTGAAGADGTAGSPGARGGSGSKGDTGAAGSAGADGAAGSPGTRGPAGADGGGGVIGIIALIIAIVALISAGGVYMMGRRA